jgi:lysozyme family protein
MNRFDYCLAVVLRAEGGYSDRQADRGGPTNAGITQKTYDQFRKGSSLSPRDVKLITADEVTAIYRTMYWVVAKCGILPPPLDLYVFDGAVNHGPGRATKILQGVLGVGADGSFGPVSISALQEETTAGHLAELCDNYLAARLDFYDDIVENDPTQRANINGWRNRIEHLRNA